MSKTTSQTQRLSSKQMNAEIAQIANKYLYIETLETQYCDRLDFHDLAVWQIKEALEAAYQAGLAAGQKAAQKAA